MNLGESLSQEPHRLGGSRETSMFKIIRDFGRDSTTKNANKPFIFSATIQASSSLPLQSALSNKI